MKFDHGLYHYPSRRNLMYARKGMVAASSPLASQAGLEVLKKGGNAIDAAVACAAALTVVEPTANGIGGDCFSIIWTGGKAYGMNSSGRAPEQMTVCAIKGKGYEEISKFGLDPVTVPGIPAGWAAMTEKFGRLSLAENLEPAARIAEDGYALSPTLAYAWTRAFNNYTKELSKYPVLKTWFDTFCPDGKPIAAGEVFTLKAHARALREIGKTNGKSFYEGDIAEEIDQFSKENNGFITKEDLKKHTVDWVEPYAINYRGIDVWELPPNGIGIIALSALNIIENFQFKGRNFIDTYHKQIEAMKLAFSDGLKHIGDIDYMDMDIAYYLSKAYAKERASLIGDRAMEPICGEIPKSGTVYFAAADGEGNMVSMIQSCYTGFGSGTVLPEWGISLHNRGNQFNLNEGHSNCLKPGKRPYHTIIPGFLSKSGTPLGPFGVMGGPMQPQAHMQVVSNMVDFSFNPQDALDAPRWQWVSDKKVKIEGATPSYIIEGLVRKGHEIELSHEAGAFGRGQIIIRQENGVLVGGTEPRADGHIAVW